MGFSTGVDYTCANSNHSWFFVWWLVCFTAGKMVISHFSVSITTLFPSGVGDELETRCSSFFNFFRLVKEGGA